MSITRLPTAVPSTGRAPDGRFAVGNPGRPFGSRNRLSQRAIATILHDFMVNQELVLPRLRGAKHLASYVHLLAHVLPQHVEVSAPEYESLTEAEALWLVGEARAALDRIEAGRASFLELEGILRGEGRSTGEADGVGAPAPKNPDIAR